MIVSMTIILLYSVMDDGNTFYESEKTFFIMLVSYNLMIFYIM